MKQQQRRTSIWFKPKKGVRAGNSPIWEGDDDVLEKVGIGEVSRHFVKMKKKYKNYYKEHPEEKEKLFLSYDED